jgi:hypothetical protein
MTVGVSSDRYGRRPSPRGQFQGKGARQLNLEAIAGSATCSIDVPPPPVKVDCPPLTTAQVGALTRPRCPEGTGRAQSTHSISPLPAGMVLASNGGITWTPSSLQVPSVTFTASIKDEIGGTDSKSCPVTVAAASRRGSTTFTQGGWGSTPSGNNPGALLATKFSTVYPGGSVQIGGPYKLKFTSASAIEDFLPNGSTAGKLTKSATNPTTSEAGILAGQLLTATLNVNFSDKGVLPAGLGDLIVVSGPMAGKTVDQVLAIANTVLGGGAVPSGFSLSSIVDALDAINNNFDNGTSNEGYLRK